MVRATLSWLLQREAMRKGHADSLLLVGSLVTPPQLMPCISLQPSHPAASARASHAMSLDSRNIMNDALRQYVLCAVAAST